MSETKPGKTAAKPQTKKAAQSKTQAGKAPRRKKVIAPEDYHRMVSEAAYYIAEKRGFSTDNPARDWFDAEAQIRATRLA